MMEDEYNLQDSIKPKKDLLSKLEDMEDERYTNDYGYSTDSFLPSSTFKKKNKKEKDKTCLNIDCHKYCYGYGLQF